MRLTGDLLARVAYALRKAGNLETTTERLEQLVQDALRAGPPHVDVPIVREAKRRNEAGLHDEARARLQALLPWGQSIQQRGFTLGTAWTAAKALPAPLVPADAARVLSSRLELPDLRILDLGCLEGLQAIGLAEAGAWVTAVDSRIENVVKTIVRAWVSGVSSRIDVHLIDVESEDLLQRLRDARVALPFDLVHHRDLLHHLVDPEAHLRRLGPALGHRLYLRTDVAADATAERPEARSPHVPFGGMQDRSRQLTWPVIDAILGEIGLDDRSLLRAPSDRIELLAARANPLPAAAPLPPAATPAQADAEPAPQPAAAALPARFRKALVLGIGRSGTSALAYLLRAFGFHLGDGSDDVIHENVGMRRRLLEGDFAGIDAELSRWAGEHDRIAWKDPKLHSAGESWIRGLPDDWLMIVAYRDPVAVARRRERSDGVEFRSSLAHCIRSQSELHRFVASLEQRVHYVSYERLIQDHACVIDELRQVLDLDGVAVPTTETLWQGMMGGRQRYREVHDPVPIDADRPHSSDTSQ